MGFSRSGNGIGRAAVPGARLVLLAQTRPVNGHTTPLAVHVGQSTVIDAPALGWLVIVRSGNVIRADPVTRRIGPIRLTSAVR